MHGRQATETAEFRLLAGDSYATPASVTRAVAAGLGVPEADVRLASFQVVSKWTEPGTRVRAEFSVEAEGQE